MQRTQGCPGMLVACSMQSECLSRRRCLAGAGLWVITAGAHAGAYNMLFFSSVRLLLTGSLPCLKCHRGLSQPYVQTLQSPLSAVSAKRGSRQDG